MGSSGCSFDRGVPSALAGRIVQVVKSTPMPTMSSGATPASFTAAGTTVHRQSI